MFVIHILSIRHQNKSCGYENNNKYTQKPKKFSRNANRKCGIHLNHNFFSENFNYDPSNNFFKPTINIRIMSSEDKGTKITKRIRIFFIMKTRFIEIIKHIVSR